LTNSIGYSTLPVQHNHSPDVKYFSPVHVTAHILMISSTAFLSSHASTLSLAFRLILDNLVIGREAETDAVHTMTFISGRVKALALEHMS
jgi:hypothetical protein